ncbi:MAG TPA: TIGR03936 family radical SAM-associated protein [Acidimicrobiales bacterium]|nr:TIGR03936 family radical SAM-associated protein [Acidimicrobiales bacterium]
MRVRLRFSKLGKIRFTSHRDVARMFERAFRRTGLPVAYSGGFAPRPKVSFGLALPTGAESVAEYLDVELSRHVDPAALPGSLSPALPVGVDVTAAAAVDGRAPSLQQEVTSCVWVVELPELGEAAVASLAGETLAARTLAATRERKGKPVTDDLRPAIISLTADGTTLTFELATQPRGVRPTEVLGVVRPDIEIGAVRRINQWIERDGARCDPMEVDPAATDAPERNEHVRAGSPTGGDLDAPVDPDGGLRLTQPRAQAAAG